MQTSSSFIGTPCGKGGASVRDTSQVEGCRGMLGSEGCGVGFEKLTELSSRLILLGRFEFLECGGECVL